MTWRLAKSLETLRSQVNALSPNRSKVSDGTIGDTAHSSRTSDHNPNDAGVVCAIDITHDPAHGIDGNQLAEAVKNDPRTKYIIWNRKIWNASVAKAWRPYTGSNPHDKHVHISVGGNYDLTTPWLLMKPPADAVAKPAAPIVPILAIGSKGADVIRLQFLLGLKQDGDFGPMTKAAVVAFQAKHGLVADGVVGAYTWDALKAPPAAKPAPASREIHVIAQHGLLGGSGSIGYSLGLDTMIAAAAAKAGLRVTSTILEHYEDEAAYQAAKAAQKRGAAVVVSGHSLGASDAVALGNRLGQEGTPVALIFVFDPTWNSAAPPVEGKVRAVNFYGTSWSPLGHDRLEAADSFKGQIFNVGIPVDHVATDDHAPAHAAFLNELRFIAGQAKAPPTYPTS